MLLWLLASLAIDTSHLRRQRLCRRALHARSCRRRDTIALGWVACTAGAGRWRRIATISASRRAEAGGGTRRADAVLPLILLLLVGIRHQRPFQGA